MRYRALYLKIHRPPFQRSAKLRLPRYPAQFSSRDDRSSAARRRVSPLGAWSIRHRTGGKLSRIPTCAGTIHPAQRRRPCARLRTACGITECTSAAAPARCPSRAALPTPDRTLLSLPRRDRTCKGAPTAVPDGQTLARRGPGAAFGPQVRREGTPPDPRSTAWAAAAADGSPLRCAPSAFMNGGGCAAAVINQWNRLRRSEYRMGTELAIPAWAPALTNLLDCGRQSPPHCLVTPMLSCVSGQRRAVRRLRRVPAECARRGTARRYRSLATCWRRFTATRHLRQAPEQ